MLCWPGPHQTIGTRRKYAMCIADENKNVQSNQEKKSENRTKRGEQGETRDGSRSDALVFFALQKRSTRELVRRRTRSCDSRTHHVSFTPLRCDQYSRGITFAPAATPACRDLRPPSGFSLSLISSILGLDPVFPPDGQIYTLGRTPACQRPRSVL